MVVLEKNKVYKWVNRLYLIPNNSGDVYLIKDKDIIEYLPQMSISTIHYYGELVGKNFNYKGKKVCHKTHTAMKR